MTLFHWDYPYELYCRGGWLNPESPEWFAEYTGIVADRLGDRVKHWITLNEPQCFLGLGHREGIQAVPGLKLAWMDVLRATHHTLMATAGPWKSAPPALQDQADDWLAPLGIVSYPATSARAISTSPGPHQLRRRQNALVEHPFQRSGL